MRVLVKGAGSIGTAIAWRLKVSGFDVLMTEVAVPTTIRRTVSFSRAVYEERAKVEGLEAVHVRTYEEIEAAIAADQIPVLVDSRAAIRDQFNPDIVVDAVMTDEDRGTRIDDAGFVVGIGHGFTAGENCHCVVETAKGHFLGRVIYDGTVKDDPEADDANDVRIVRSVAEGEFVPVRHIGDKVNEGDVVGRSADREVLAGVSGIIRGLLQKGAHVYAGMKSGEIDPDGAIEYCYTMSDRSRAVAGGVLEAVHRYVRRRVSIGIILLAAGEGKRFGSNKLLAKLDGKPLYKYSLEAAIATGCECTIVTGYDEIAKDASAKGVKVVRNDDPEAGIAQSLTMGLEAMKGKNALIFTVCDQPGVTTDTYYRLIAAYATGTKGLSCMGQGQNLLGNPCIFGRKYYKELMTLTGDTGGKKIIMRHTDDLSVVAALEEELKDIDYSKDLPAEE